MRADGPLLAAPQIATLAEVFDKRSGDQAIAVALAQANAGRGDVAATWLAIIGQLADSQTSRAAGR